MNQFPPGSLARLNGEPVTILAQAEGRTYYIPGFQPYGCTKHPDAHTGR